MQYTQLILTMSIALRLLMGRSGRYAVHLTTNQAYNEHNRIHSLKFQSLSSPNGLIVDLTGPWEGRHHAEGEWIAAEAQKNLKYDGKCLRLRRSSISYI
jgi:hypothetical protein